MKDTESNEKRQVHELPRRPAWASRPSAQLPSSKAPSATAAAPMRSKCATTTTSTRSTRLGKGTDSAVSSKREREKERDREKQQSKKIEVVSSPPVSEQSEKEKESETKVAPIVARSSTPLDDSDRGSSTAEGPIRAKSPLSQDVAPPGLTLPSSSNDATAYQPSTAAQALLDDVRIRRHQQQNSVSDPTLPQQISPFPDFDRTMRVLGVGSSGGDAGLKFSFDFETNDLNAEADALNTLGLSSMGAFDTSTRTPPARYTSNFDPFAGSPPGIPTNSEPRQSVPPTTFESRYRGSFDPFADLESVSSHPSPAPSFAASYDGERTMSRFDFARRGTPAKNFSALPSILGSDGRRGSPLISSPIDFQQSSPYNFNSETNLSRYQYATQSTPSRTSTVPPEPNSETVPSLGQSAAPPGLGQTFAPPGLGQLNLPPGLGQPSVALGLAQSDAPPGLGQMFNQPQSISLSQLFGSGFETSLGANDAPPSGFGVAGSHDQSILQRPGV